MMLTAKAQEAAAREIQCQESSFALKNHEDASGTSRVIGR
jgi:hypothetical protein